MSPDGICSILPNTKIVTAKSDSSLFSSFSFWLNSDAGTGRDALRPDFQARARAENSVALCNLNQLAADSCFLSNSALENLCKALIAMCLSSVDTSESVAVLLLEIVCDVSLRNKDRVHVWWELLSELLVSLVNSTSVNFVTERAVVNVLRIANRLFARDGFSQQMLSVLKVLMNINESLSPRLIEQVAAGLVPFVGAYFEAIDQCQGWETIFHLLSKCKVSNGALVNVIQIVSHVIRRDQWASSLNNRTFVLSLRLLTEVTPVLVKSGHVADQDPTSPVPQRSCSIQGRPSAASPAVPDTTEPVLRNVIELLFELHASVRGVFSDAPRAGYWPEYWLPISRALGSICLDSRKLVRQSGKYLYNEPIFYSSS